jgi:hypothetical protein
MSGDNGDAGLLAAERELRELRARGVTDDTAENRLWSLADKISQTPPVTLSGVLVKLRLLEDRLLEDKGIGLLASYSEADRVSLRQVREFVEGKIAAECCGPG